MKIAITLKWIVLVAIAILIILIVVMSIAPLAGGPDIMTGNTVTFSGLSGPVTLKAEIADTPQEHSRGLMKREHLDSGSGMLFIFDGDSQRSFWMKDTLIPLDMIFINSSLDIVHIEVDAQPCKTPSCPRYNSGQPAMYVVETNAGFVHEHGIVTGQKVGVHVLI